MCSVFSAPAGADPLPPAAALSLTGAVAVADQEHRPHAGMLRFPDVSATDIVFLYADDLWLASREGGLARPLAGPPGQELLPKFSPDGRTICFVGNYEGNPDLYTIAAGGGIAARITHHPAGEVLCDWTPRGRLLYSTSGFAGLPRQTQLWTVSATGGMPEKLPVPYGANGTISPDGEWLAYTPHSRDFRTWKRYRGGMATDVWLFHLKNHTSKKITDWEGTDTLPMWHGRKVYYLSDEGPEHRLNLWVFDTDTDERRQVTNFEDYDVKWPSIGPGPDGKGEIVFQNGVDLYLLDLGTDKSHAVEVRIPGDRPKIRPKTVDASKSVFNGNISSTGKRAVLEARGDLWTLPAEKGTTRNLTRTDDVAERDPAWSPDGQWIAYFSDATGEYELYIRQSDGRGEARQLTTDGGRYRYNPTWSPDSKMILFSDKSGALFLHTIEVGRTALIDTDPTSAPPQVSWSHDSAWVAYTKRCDNQQSSIWLYDVKAGKKQWITRGMFNDSLPTFDRKGDYLFFASSRKFESPIYEDVGSTFVYANTEVLAAVALNKDVASPLSPKSDEETWEDEEKPGDKDKDKDKEEAKKKDGDGDASVDDDKAKDSKDEAAEDEHDAKNGEKDKKKKDDKIEPIKIDLDDLERRTILLPVKPGVFAAMAVNDKGHLIYARRAARGQDDKPSIMILDLEDDKHEEKTVLKDVGAFAISSDGKKLLVSKGDETMAIVNAAADQKMDKPISKAGMKSTIDPRSEWRQMFNEAWRIQRDFFYDPNMHGVDWPAMRKQYALMLDDCVSRSDLSFVIGEMISELNVGHAYARGGGDFDPVPSVSVGMLGCDFELDSGAYRITRIHEGAPWDLDARGPLSQPGVDVKEGDYLLAVNGVPLDTSKDVWAAFVGLADSVVTLTVSEKSVRDDDARTVVVKPLSNEATLRYRAWIEKNRAFVEEKSGGKVGYVYVPDTGVNGQNNLIRQFFGQRDKKALIIDERWNGGGQIPNRFIELLNRPVSNYWAVRDGRDWVWPPDAHHGPKCMLINGLAGSGGDCFPYYFRQSKLGKLIGMRTWGGLVGISGNPILIDGGRTTSPTFAFYETDGTWGVEGHGVDPDIEVVDDPSLMVNGGDPQLDTAIALMLKELETNSFVPPPRPDYVNRSGMGIREQDK
jgi:tricorn protease